MKSLFRRHPYLTSALALATALTLFFAVRFLVGAIYWSAHQHEPIRGWMTVGYIGRSWGLEPPEIDKAAGLPMPQGHPLTLLEIAKQRGVPVSEIIAHVEEVVVRMKAEQQ